MFLELNFNSGKATYLQIVDQVRMSAASGALRAGEALPGIRTLAEQLRINRNTVSKAYGELERQGVVEHRPGRGCFVREQSSPLKSSVKKEMLKEVIDAAIVQAHQLQVSREDFLEAVEERLGEFQLRESTSEKTNKV
ncbi:MAG: GntR family transcriptional regulator [Verrucomicrobiota bacterium]|jgi:GntR family transcriptional regulator